jgi:hypothetical protein
MNEITSLPNRSTINLLLKPKPAKRTIFGVSYFHKNISTSENLSVLLTSIKNFFKTPFSIVTADK